MGELISFDRERAVRRSARGAGVVRPSVAPTSVTPAPVALRPVATPGAALGPLASPSAPRPAAGREPLWREVSGAVLRDERRRQGRTLVDVAGRAGMSVQHLSEVERGRKEASSEMLAAAAGSLGLGLAELARRCALTLSGAGAAPTGPVLLAA